MNTKNLKNLRSRIVETKPERVFREELDRRGLEYQEQFPTRSGFILDFAFPEKRICVEIDGVHWHSTKKQRKRDRFREYILKRGGWKIVRFWCYEVYGDVGKCVDSIME